MECDDAFDLLFVKAELPAGYCTITSAEKTEVDEVFDLTVEETHCYASGGVISHNSGKSWIVIRKALEVHVFNAFGRDGKPTGCMSAAFAPTYSGLQKYVVPDILEGLEAMGIHAEYKKSFKRGRFTEVIVLHSISTRDQPSMIQLMSAETPSAIQGAEYGMVLGDEATRMKQSDSNPKDDAILQIIGRLRCPKARIRRAYFCGSPEGTATRFYRESVSGKPGYAAYRISTRENKAVSEYLERQLSILTPDQARAYIDGETVSLSGLNVYPQFKKAVHVTDEDFDLDLSHPLQVTFDFNIAPGMVAYVGQFADDRFRIRHQIFDKGLTLTRCMDELIRLIQTAEEDVIVDGKLVKEKVMPFPILEVFGDSAGNNRWAGTGESQYALIRQKLEDAGVKYRISVKAANPQVIDRENAVDACMGDARGVSHLVVHKSCTRLINDFETMARDDKGVFPKDKFPELGHGADAVGYWIEKLRPVRSKARERTGRINAGMGGGSPSHVSTAQEQYIAAVRGPRVG